jgi:hypothetical protein
MPGTGITMYDIYRTEHKIIRLIVKVLDAGGQIITSDYKQFLSHFKIPSVPSGVYDIFLPDLPIPNNMERAKSLLNKVLSVMSKHEPQQWQRIAADAAVVYQSMENRGVLSGTVLMDTKWSQRTYSGRGKSSGFNVQGATKDDDITNPHGSVQDIQLHFDWRAADIRMAALLSKDDKLNQMSLHGDPYIAMANEIGGVSRDECKIGLLSAINAMVNNNPILDMFPDLKIWISECNSRLDEGAPLHSILHRKFKSGPKRRSPFNATMQGSIAHAMQICIRRVWEEYGDNLLVEIHDSLVVTCRPDPTTVQSVILNVVGIMLHPFRGIMESDPALPVRVSIGKCWKKWKEHKVYY